jgi:hypothetical protein
MFLKHQNFWWYIKRFAWYLVSLKPIYLVLLHSTTEKVHKLKDQIFMDTSLQPHRFLSPKDTVCMPEACQGLVSFIFSLSSCNSWKQNSLKKHVHEKNMSSYLNVLHNSTCSCSIFIYTVPQLCLLTFILFFCGVGDQTQYLTHAR